MSLKSKAITGVRWTTFSSMVNAILQLLQLAILARFLNSNDFGIIAILGVVVDFSQLLVDFGLSKSIIYKQNITDEQLSTIYWLNIFFALIIYFALYFVSPYIGIFYKEDDLSEYIMIISTILIIQSFGQQFRALFQKELHFSLLAKIDIFATIIAFVTMIMLVLLHFGIYAYIFSIIVITLLKTILLVINGIKKHKPKFVLRLRESKEFFVFGLYSTGDDIINTISSQMDIILIGKLLGTESLGMYNIVKELILRPAQLINPIITKVSFPIMAKVNNDVKQVKAIYLKVINFVASVNFPVYIASIILAPEIVTLFLGKQWTSSIEIFQILAIWALLRSIGNPVGSLLLALGKPQYGMHWNIAMLFYMPIMLYVFSSFGIQGIAWGNVVSMFILFIPGWYFLLYKVSLIRLKEYILAFTTALLISSSIGLIVYALLKIYEGKIIYNMLLTTIVGLILLIILNKKYNPQFFETFILAIKNKNHEK